MKKVFFDTEFTDLTQDCELISIGLVYESEEAAYGFYAVSTDFSRLKCSEFVRHNIIPKLTTGVYPLAPGITFIEGSQRQIREALIRWFDVYVDIDTDDESPQVQMWSDCLAYDWVLFRTLFQDNLPSFIYYIPFDLCTLFLTMGIDPDVSREEFAGEAATDKDKHNAYFDACQIKRCYDKLTKNREVDSWFQFR